MSALERKMRTRWPGLQWYRRVKIRQERQAAKRAIRAGRDEDCPGQHKHSAKWEVW